MKTTDRLQEAQAIGKATMMLETMNTRLAASNRGWVQKQLADWQSLRQLCNQQIARATLPASPTDGKETEAPGEQPELKAVQ